MHPQEEVEMAYPYLSHPDLLKHNTSQHPTAADKVKRTNLIAGILAAIWIVAAFAYAVTSSPSAHGL
jgi:hypothetical protein